MPDATAKMFVPANFLEGRQAKVLFNRVRRRGTSCQALAIKGAAAAGCFGGLSTGPETSEGCERIRQAKTSTGFYSAPRLPRGGRRLRITADYEPRFGGSAATSSQVAGAGFPRPSRGGGLLCGSRIR